MAVYGRVEVAHGEVDGAHVANLARLLQPVAHLLHQLHALLVRRQRVGVVADGRAHVTWGVQGGLLVCREGYWCAGRVTGVKVGLLVCREGYWCAGRVTGVQYPSQRLL